MEKKTKLYVSCGEVSGDLLLSELVLRLTNDYEIRGLYGQFTQSKLNKQSDFDLKNLSVMGFYELAFRYFKIKRFIKIVGDAILHYNPEIVLCVDAPSFHIRLAKYVKSKNTNIKFVQYVLPKVWVWRKQRVKHLNQLFDKLLSVLPFEQSFFKEKNVDIEYVGHTAINRFSKAERFIEKPYLLFLLGSRKFEINYQLPIYKETAINCKNLYPNHEVIFYTLPQFETQLCNNFKNTSIKIITDPSLKESVFKYADLSIATSGTVTLELAILGVPHIVTYKTHWLTLWILKYKINPQLKWVSLTNLILNQSVVPEILNKNLTNDNLIRNIRLVMSVKDFYRKGVERVRDVMKTEQPTVEMVKKAIDDLAKKTPKRD